ncbi:DUF4232 domain-containing protein [Nocardia thailandica]|uniref:DUF4232 domain-containing protein n=1 Tax=Nocardia thailandica TaxID=257275 RepID=UPI0002E49CBB|nr:DUF4232 domain-containing protein [Nocardia thailandica]
MTRGSVIVAAAVCVALAALPACDSTTPGTAAPAGRGAVSEPPPGPAVATTRPLTPAAPAPPGVPPPPTTPVTAAPPTTPATDAGTPACRDGQVIVGAEPMGAAAGHQGVRLTFGLVGASAPCTLTGYPGVDATGHGQVPASRTPRGYLGGLPAGEDRAPTVLLTQDRAAEATVEGTAVGTADQGCPVYTALLVTPPNTTETTTHPVALTACALQVHPVRAAG